MLTADQIEALGDKAQQIISKVTDFLIEDIARRISEAGQLTSTAAYQTWRLQQLGVSQRQLKKELRKRLNVSDKELEQLLTQAAEVGYNFDIRNLPTEDAIPFSENSSIQQIVSSAIQLAQENLTNITQTIGFVTPNGKAVGLTDAYKEACDFAFSKVVTGAQDYNSAIREATKNLTEKGIVTIDYDSGVHTSLEAAVRRNIMGGLGLMQEQISRQNHDDLGCDGWEISAHSASAPDHEPIQGKQYSDAAFEKLNNSLVRRIGTLNCGHAAFPIIMGVNSPQYTDAELEEMRQDNEKGVNYEGRHYTQYEATQRQRQLERSIRKQKRRILAAEQNPNDKERLQQAQIKYQVLDQEYKRFSKAAGLRLQHERMEMAGFGAKQARDSENTVQSTEEDVFKNKKMDLSEMSKKVDEELGKHCSRPSKWSGKTVVKPRDAMVGVAGRKEWSCDITLREDAGVKTVVHEHLHARSVSYYDRETYLAFQRVEEGTVELFAQEICLMNKASFRQSYTEPVKHLRIINSITKTAECYNFAKQLFDIPLPERYNWLREIADAAIATGNLSDKSVQALNNAVKYLRGKGVK